ncbi:MAG: PilT/PilU family type 4a pilus ATPase [Candidatus Scalindua sp.]|nr:PilT/PilU family type 4a pilus ATPase [Candidatus Scalindua sp.]
MSDNPEEIELKIDPKITNDIESMLDGFISVEASDLHVKEGEAPVSRSNGELLFNNNVKKFSKKHMYALVNTIFACAGKYSINAIATRTRDFIENGQEEDLAFLLPMSEYRARVNLYKTMGKIGIALRKIPDVIPELDSLGIATTQFDSIKKRLLKQEGLILVTGQTGSGKSTTMAGIINFINKNHKKHIITIESPVEFVHENAESIITHREVGIDDDTSSFNSGVVASLRQDPDIIFIGEIRDIETAEAALSASNTGHLVFATLHTNSASESVARIIDLFPAEKKEAIRGSLSNALQMVISQKLIPTITQKRVLACELFLAGTSGTRAAIASPKSDSMIRDKIQSGSSDGMINMQRYLFNLVTSSDIDRAVALEYANDQVELESLLKKKV